jgi:phage-related protein
MVDKTIVWIGSSRDDLRRFPKEAQRKAGYQLRLVQQGKEPDDFKPMPSVGPGAYEIRVQLGDAYRVFYVVQVRGGGLCLTRVPKENPKDGKARYRDWWAALQRGPKPAPRGFVNWRRSSSSKVAIMYSKI